MMEVTVLFLDQTFSSTAIGPMEVFRHAGTLWNFLTGKRQVPRFRVTTASVDGRAVRCDGPIHIRPQAALAAIRKTDLIFIPTTGISLDDVVERNAPVVPWLRRWHKRGAAMPVCAQVWVWLQPPACWTASAPPRTGAWRSGSGRNIPMHCCPVNSWFEDGN